MRIATPATTYDKIMPSCYVFTLKPIAELAIIQDGFRDVVTGTDANTTGTMLQNSKMEISAKTGTAEMTVTDNGKVLDVENLNAVS